MTEYANQNPLLAFLIIVAVPIILFIGTGILLQGVRAVILAWAEHTKAKAALTDAENRNIITDLIEFTKNKEMK